MELKIFNINMWLLPFYASKDNKKRLDRLVNFLKKEKPDIVTVQEIWLRKHIKYLENKVKGYYFTYQSGKLINRSGLITLSKASPEAKKMYSFRRHIRMNILERIVNKGMLLTQYEYNGKIINIINTHLYNPSQSTKKITNNQFDELINNCRTQFESFSKRISDEVHILCGDLNLTIEEFHKNNKGFFNIIEDAFVTISSNNRYNFHWSNKKGRKEVKLDYILAKQDNKTLNYISKTISNGLSDHYGIMSILNI